jgi:hypothetical protein
MVTLTAIRSPIDSSAQMTAVNGYNVAFRGAFSGGSGLYARFGGSLVRVADTTTAIPNGTGNFTALKLGLVGLVWWGRRYRRQSAAQRVNPSSKLTVAV